MTEVFKSAKVDVYMNIVGEEKQAKEVFNDVVNGATGTQLLAFADLMADLCDADHSMSHCVGSVSTTYMN